MSTIPRYPMNTQVQFTVNSYNANGQPADPVSMMYQTGGPDGSVHSVPATRVTQGQYFANWVTATPGGKWWYRFVATGSIQGQTEDLPYSVQIPQF